MSDQINLTLFLNQILYEIKSALTEEAGQPSVNRRSEIFFSYNKTRKRDNKLCKSMACRVQCLAQGHSEMHSCRTESKITD